MALRGNLQRRFLSVGALIIVVGLVAASDSLREEAEAVVFWTEGMISAAPLLGMLVFVLLAMLSAMVAFFSSALLAPIAIHAWGEVACFALLWTGWFLGGIASFAVGRLFGRSAVSMIIGEEKLANWESQVSEHTRFIHILFFQAVVPSEIPGYVLGILRYRLCGILHQVRAAQTTLISWRHAASTIDSENLFCMAGGEWSLLENWRTIHIWIFRSRSLFPVAMKRQASPT